MADATQVHRAHHAAQAGPKAEKAKAKGRERHAGGFNPKAFIAAHPFAADKHIRRKAELDQQRLHVPLVDRTPAKEPPPVIVAIVGPQGVGKTTLMRSLIPGTPSIQWLTYLVLSLWLAARLAASHLLNAITTSIL